MYILTPISAPRRLVASLSRITLLLLLPLIPTMSRAQGADVGGTWRDIDLERLLDLPTNHGGTVQDSFYFYDALNGVRTLRPLYDSYTTSDGGATWRRITELPLLPHGRLDDGIAWRRSGHFSTDGGRTWQDPPFLFTDFQAGSLQHRSGVASTGNGRERLYSGDGGATWISVDSLIAIGRIGPLPAPPHMTDATRGWGWLVGQSASTIDVITTATGTIDAAAAVYYYLTTIDVEAATISSIELPMWRGLSLASARPRVFRLESGRVIAPEMAYDSYFLEWYLKTIWMTGDAGVTWSRHDSLLWVDYPRLHFFTPTLGITTNAKTTDAGRTWQRMGRPFGRAFFALDTARWFVADTFNLVGRSIDAGATWTRSASGAPIRAIIAHRGNVAIARQQRGVAVSGDGGVTWSDVGTGDGLPDNLAQLVAMTFLDTLEAPGKAIGLAGFVDESGLRTARVVHSDDYGRTWREGARVPTLDFAVFGGDAIQFPMIMRAAPSIEGSPRTIFIGGVHGLVASIDDGATWRPRTNQIAVYGMAVNSGLGGAAITGDWTEGTLGLSVTTDGGYTWRETYRAPDGYVYPVGLQLLDDGYRAIFASFSADYRGWVVATSVDGAFWNERRATYDGPALKGSDAYWSSARRVHIVGRGASILFSRDAGASVEVHHDSLRSFFHPMPPPNNNPPDDLHYRPLLSARDGLDLYVASYFGDVGVWTIGNDVLAAPLASLDFTGLSVTLSNDGGTALVRVASGIDARDVSIVDVLGSGRSLLGDAWTSGASTSSATTSVATSGFAPRSGGHEVRVDLSALVPGTYFITLRADGGSRAIPIVVRR